MIGPGVAPHFGLSKHRVVWLDDAHRRFADPKRRTIVPWGLGPGKYRMKYLLNLPLAVAALLQVWFASLVFMSAPWSGWSDGPSRGAMVLVMLEPVALAWILLLPVIAGSVFADAFDWLPVRRRWLQLTLVLGASVLIGILVIPCVLVAIGESAAVGQTEDKHLGPVLIGGATIAATVVPLIGMAWLAWLIDAPPLSRHAALPRRISLTALALMALIGGILGTDMLREEIAVSRETAARYQRMDDERAATTRAGFGKLTDADPLRNWLGYTDRFTSDDIRQAALRRLAARPTLERDLIAALGSADTELADDTLLVVAAIPFQPSAALEAPIRTWIGRLADKIRTVRRTGEDSDYDTYVDRWFAERLAAALAVSKKMAENAGVDLSEALRDLQSAIAEAYPKSDAAKTYPRAVAVARAHIDTTLAARRQRN